MLSSCLRSVRPSSLSFSRLLSSVSDRFTAAQTKLNTLSDDPGNEAKLKIYGLFKQANVGPCNLKKPSSFNMVAKFKYEAWNSLGTMSKDEAMEAYIALVDELAGGDVEEVEEEVVSSGVEGIDITSSTGVTTITLNRPAKKNALTWAMYVAIGDTLKAAAEDDNCKIVVLTGAGDWYSSGNDLSNFTKDMPKGGPPEMAATARGVLNVFVDAMITFPKPLIAAVNGPAIGIPVTTLGLCDLVYCTEAATFKTPFVSLGQSPEGCSSYLFPRTFGFAKANEMLLTERQISAQEACDGGLVTRIFPEASFKEEVSKIASHMASLPPQSMKISKALIRHEHIDKLLAVNYRECETLEERWLSKECMTAIMNFLSRKK